MSLKNAKKFLILLFAFAFFIPLFALAQFNVGSVQPGYLPASQNPVIDIINRIINYVIWPAAVVGVVILFIMAGFKFLNAKGEPTELQTARRFLIWGTVGTVVILISFSVMLTVKALLGII